MQLIEDLQREHELIDQVLGSLRAFVDARLAGRGEPSDGARYLAFFRHFAGDFHHDKEAAVLFRALVEQAELPADRGPVFALAGEHRRMAGLLEAMDGLLDGPLDAEADRARLRALAVDYSRSLWHHIDAENSVMFPESEERLRRSYVYELPSRPMTEAERAAQDDAQSLLAAFPPQEDPDLVRGDGCVACPAFGTTCEGLETEWWTESEWEERWDRMGGD
jgi:hemerythrin-like domain-containing protein